MKQPSPAPKRKPTTIDEYLAGVAADKRAALEQLRRAIHAAAPGLIEAINYGIPAFRLDGKLLVAMGAAARHCSFYPGSVVRELTAELKGYDTSSGTIRFAADQPLPATLVRKIIKARIAARRWRAKAE